MANEISVAVNLAASKNSASIALSSSLQQDMAGDQMIANVQIVGTSNEVLSVVDVSTVGWIAVKNLDADNYVEIFLDSGNTYLIAKLLPGEVCLVKPLAAVYARANTGACNCLVVAIEL